MTARNRATTSGRRSPSRSELKKGQVAYSLKQFDLDARGRKAAGGTKD
jgi:hypothetical protein